MNSELLLRHFDRISEAPDAVARLRRFILDLAVRGKLVQQAPGDESAAELLKRIQSEVQRQKQAGTYSDPRNSIELPPAILPFAVPGHWKWVRLIEVADISYGFAFESARFNADGRGMPLIRIRDISSTDTEAYFDGEYDESYIVRQGDYLIGMDGNFSLRKWAGGEALLNQRVLRIKNWKAGLAAEFLAIPLQMILDFLHGQTSQTTVKHLSAKQMNGVYLPLPPLAEQHRIVAKVDELMALCDQLEVARSEREAGRDRLVAASLHRIGTVPAAEGATQDEAQTATALRQAARFHLDHLPRLTTRPEHIKQLRQTILNLAVRGRLVSQNLNDEPIHLPAAFCEKPPADVPAKWTYTRLVNVLSEDTRNGYSRKPDDAPDGVPILRISAGTVRPDGVVAEEEHKLISGIAPDVRLQYGVSAGDLLACRFNGNKAFVGRLTIFNDYLGIRPIYPDKLIRVRTSPHLAVPAFLRLAGDTDLVRSEVEAACATTVGNWGISASKLKEIRFPIPPLAEQHRIIAKVDELMALCDQLETQLTTSEADSRRLLEAVLRDALAA